MDMLSTFLTQIINYYPQLTDTIEALSMDFKPEHGWTEFSLLKLFHLVSAADGFAQVVFLLNHFDKCTETSGKALRASSMRRR